MLFKFSGNYFISLDVIEQNVILVGRFMIQTRPDSNQFQCNWKDWKPQGPGEHCPGGRPMCGKFVLQNIRIGDKEHAMLPITFFLLCFANFM